MMRFVFQKSGAHANREHSRMSDVSNAAIFAQRRESMFPRTSVTKESSSPRTPIPADPGHLFINYGLSRNGCQTRLSCQSLRFGAFAAKPARSVEISASGVSMDIKGDRKGIATVLREVPFACIAIPFTDIESVLYSFESAPKLICLQVTAEQAETARTALGISTDLFDVQSELRKYVVLVISALSKAQLGMLQLLFNTFERRCKDQGLRDSVTPLSASQADLFLAHLPVSPTKQKRGAATSRDLPDGSRDGGADSAEPGEAKPYKRGPYRKRGSEQSWPKKKIDERSRLKQKRGPYNRKAPYRKRGPYRKTIERALLAAGLEGTYDASTTGKVVVKAEPGGDFAATFNYDFESNEDQEQGGADEAVENAIKAYRSRRRSANHGNELFRNHSTNDYVTDSQLPAEVLDVMLPVKQLFVYRGSGDCSLIVTDKDKASLEGGHYISDAIIDFYLRYIVDKLAPWEMQRSIHVLSSYFWTALTDRARWPSVKNLEPESLMPNTPRFRNAVAMHAAVSTLTKDVDWFSKDFILIPINNGDHWVLAVVCYPGLVDPAAKAESSNQNAAKSRDGRDGLIYSTNPLCSVFDESDSESEYDFKPEPAILLFNSLYGEWSSDDFNFLLDYLTVEWSQHKRTSMVFEKSNMHCYCPRVPQQANFSDSGVFVLQYAEAFLKCFKEFFVTEKPDLRKWFTRDSVTAKRGQIRDLIDSLAAQFDADPECFNKKY